MECLPFLLEMNEFYDYESAHLIAAFPYLLRLKKKEEKKE
jgi:hypothetical protein